MIQLPENAIIYSFSTIPDPPDMGYKFLCQFWVQQFLLNISRMKQ